MERDVLEVRIRPRLGCRLGHVQLVADVRVQVHALGRDGLDRLARELQRDRHVAEERPVGVGDDRALVADDRVVEPGLGEVARDRPVHAAGDDHDVDARRPSRGGARHASAGAGRRRRRRACGRSRRRTPRPRRGTREGASAAGDAGDVGRHVGDLLLAELALERRHRAGAVGDAVRHERFVGLRLVEVRADRAGGARVRERVARDAAGGDEDLLARRRVAGRRRRRWSRRRRCRSCRRSSRSRRRCPSRCRSRRSRPVPRCPASASPPRRRRTPRRPPAGGPARAGRRA